MANGGAVSAATVKEMHSVAELIVSDVAKNVHSALALNDLANADGYTLKHSLAVTTLGLSLGMRVMRKYGWVDGIGKRRYDQIEDRLTVLGVGLLLHDIGKLAVPQEILQKPGPLNDEEWLAMREHPMLGVQILKKAEGISPLTRAVVRSHHERWNGAGYPDKQKAQDIHQFARIAAVADVFDALTSNRYYRKAMPVHEGYEFIMSRSGVDFDPEVTAMFGGFVAPYPPGTAVRLSDGACGLVKDVKTDQVKFPIVRVVADGSGSLVGPTEIDLGVMRNLTIVSTDVRLPEAALA
jgi:HD-GYP domain-containing protein (c-di-GMP phosphodiesterase class II)